MKENVNGGDKRDNQMSEKKQDCEHKKFLKYLEKCVKKVKAWPKWKREWLKPTTRDE